MAPDGLKGLLKGCALAGLAEKCASLLSLCGLGVWARVALGWPLGNAGCLLAAGLNGSEGLACCLLTTTLLFEPEGVAAWPSGAALTAEGAWAEAAAGLACPVDELTDRRECSARGCAG